MGPQEALTGPTTDSAGSVTGPPLPLTLFAAPVVAGVAAVAWTGRRVFLYQDDYVFLTQAREQDFGLAYLRGDLFGHFSPLTRLVNAAVVDALPTNLWMVRAGMLVLAAAYAVAVVLLSVTVLGRTRLGLVAAFSLATSLAVLPLANWWTAGFNILPAVTCSALCLTGVVRLAGGGSARWGVLALVSYAIAVLDYESTMLVAGYSLLWVLLFVRRVGDPGPIAVLRRSWWLWAGFVTIGGLALINYRVNYWAPTPRATPGETAAALAASLVEVQLPLLLGFSGPGDGRLMRVGSLVAAAALTGLLIWLGRRRAGARGLVFALAGWALPSAALVLSRVGLYGEGMVHQPYYYALSTVLVVVGLGMALSAPSSRVGPRPARFAQVLPVGLSMLGVVAGAAWVLSAGPAARSVWTADPGNLGVPAGDGRYVDRLAQSGAALEPDATLIDSDVPESVVLAAFAPYNRLHVVAALNGVDVPFGVLDRTPYAAAGDGALVPATLSWSEQLDVRTGAEAGLVITGSDGPVRAGPSGACFATAQATRVEWAVPSPVRGERLIVRAEATVDAETPARLVVTGADGVATPANYDGTRWSPREAGALDTVATDRVHTIVYDTFAPGRTVCLMGLAIGTWSTS